jgi:hypothetical protein
MHGTVSAHQCDAHALLVYLALLIVTACGGEEWRTPSGPTPTPPTTSAPSAVWKDLGEYTMTMTAAPSCSLPDYAMARTYNARLKERGQDLVADFDDPNFVCGWWGCGFTGTRDGEAVRFTLNSWEPGATEYAFIYLVSPGTELGYIGTATGQMSDRVIATTFNGAVVLYAEGTYPPKELARCDAPDHHMELLRK